MKTIRVRVPVSRDEADARLREKYLGREVLAAQRTDGWCEIAVGDNPRSDNPAPLVIVGGGWGWYAALTSVGLE